MTDSLLRLPAVLFALAIVIGTLLVAAAYGTALMSIFSALRAAS